MPDMLRTQSNERLDLVDFQYLAEDAWDAAQRQPGSSWLTPSAQRMWVMSGFAPSNPAGAQLQVDRGVALLGRREGGTPLYGVVAAEGDVQKIVDMVAYGNGTYGVYIRFDYVDSDLQSRIFWNPAGTGSEFAQSVNTRYAAQWSLRIETGSPGAEWHQIASVVKSGGAITITDTRKFYFEGAVDTTYANEWGTGNDRNANRALYGCGDLRTWSSAMRTRMTELGGQEWWRQNLDGTGMITKVDENDFFATPCHVSGYVATNPSGFTVRVTAGVAYVSGRRIAVTNATTLGYVDLTMPPSTTRYVELLSTGVLQLITHGAQTGLVLWDVTSGGGGVTLLTDKRVENPRRYSGNMILQNAMSFTWMNAAGTGKATRLYSDGADAVVMENTGATFLYATYTAGNIGINKLAVGIVDSTMDSYLSADTKFFVYTDGDTATPLARFQRESNPDSTGSIDFIVSSTVNNRILSRGKSFYVGTYAALPLYLTTNNTERFRIDGSTSKMYSAGSSSSACLVSGGILLQGETYSENEHAFMLIDRTLTHGMTDFVDTNCYLGLRSHTGSGAEVRGFGDNKVGLYLTAFSVVADTTTSTGGVAPVQVGTAKKSGTGITSWAAGDNIFTVRNAGATQFIVKGDGSVYVHTSTGAGNVGTYDEQQDALACRDLAYGMAGQWKRTWQYSAARLEDMGIMKNGFLNLQNGLAMGLSGISEVFQVLDWVLRNKLNLSYEDVRQQIRAAA
jgi:hypothetical protein